MVLLRTLEDLCASIVADITVGFGITATVGVGVGSAGVYNTVVAAVVSAVAALAAAVAAVVADVVADVTCHYRCFVISITMAPQQQQKISVAVLTAATTTTAKAKIKSCTACAQVLSGLHIRPLINTANNSHGVGLNS